MTECRGKDFQNVIKKTFMLRHFNKKRFVFLNLLFKCRIFKYEQFLNSTPTNGSIVSLLSGFEG